jgi:hypothetical protein
MLDSGMAEWPAGANPSASRGYSKAACARQYHGAMLSHGAWKFQSGGGGNLCNKRLEMSTSFATGLTFPKLEPTMLGEICLGKLHSCAWRMSYDRASDADKPKT